jgi:hypothetical protein
VQNGDISFGEVERGKEGSEAATVFMPSPTPSNTGWSGDAGHVGKRARRG